MRYLMVAALAVFMLNGCTYKSVKVMVYNEIHGNDNDARQELSDSTLRSASEMASDGKLALAQPGGNASAGGDQTSPEATQRIDTDNSKVDSDNQSTTTTTTTGVVAPAPVVKDDNGTPAIGYVTETVDLRQVDDRYFGWCNLPGAAYGKDIVLDDGHTVTRVADPSKNFNKGTGNGNPIWSAGDDNNPGVNSGGKAGYHSGTGYSPTTLTITYQK